MANKNQKNEGKDKNSHARIYVAGIFAQNILRLVEGIDTVKEIRDAYAIPRDGKLEKVWHVEFEDFDAPPKFYAKNLPYRNIDEIVQYTLFPLPDRNITTTQYLQSQISESDLEQFKNAPCRVRIYNGEHPISETFDRIDGTIILSDLSTLEELMRSLEKGLKGRPYSSVIATKENLIFDSQKRIRK